MNRYDMDYNTSREKLRMPEYGRNILRMVEKLRTIEDRDKRTEQAHAIVKSMEILNPQVQTSENYEHKLWDHLYIIAGFDLDVDSPYPCPSKENFTSKPLSIPLKDTKVRANHYGRNIENIIGLLCDGASFALRCFQRLSEPNAATQPCPGRDN